MGRVRLIVLLCAILAAALPSAALAGGDGKSRLRAEIGWGPLSSREAARRVERTAWERGR